MPSLWHSAKGFRSLLALFARRGICYNQPMSTPPVPYVSPDDYLQDERTAPFKSEYYSGQVWAMSGVSREHDAIAFNLTALLRGLLRGTPCRGFTSNMRVAVADTLYTYPDLAVVCGEAHFQDAHADTLTNPTVLIEILSPSTANMTVSSSSGAAAACRPCASTSWCIRTPFAWSGLSARATFGRPASIKAKRLFWN